MGLGRASGRAIACVGGTACSYALTLLSFISNGRCDRREGCSRTPGPVRTLPSRPECRAVLGTGVSA